MLAATGPVPAAAADVAEEVLAKGIEAYQAGKFEPAIGGINAALRGRLPAAQMARAYYYRGLAHRKQGNPGRAISDFSLALDYPGLTDAERSDLQESREATYREAGISEGERVVVATARETSTAPPAPETPSFQTSTIVTTGAVSAPQPAATPAPSPPPTASDWRGSTQTATAAGPPTVVPKDQPRPAAARWVDSKPVEAAPLPPVAPTKPASPPVPQSAMVPLGSVVAAPPPPLAKPREAPAAEPLPPFVTQVAAVTPAMPIAAAAPPVNPQAVPPPVHIVVGEVRSASEAFALSIRLISQRGAALGPRKPEIMHATMANGEILYRLRLGPYAAESDALALCQSLRDSGYACITQ
jgi:hypothetical protein